MATESLKLSSLLFPEQLSSLTPKDCPHLLLQAISGPLAAATASTLTNPMDVVRARVQVRAQNVCTVWGGVHPGLSELCAFR